MSTCLFTSRENPSSSPPKKQPQPQNPRPIDSDAPIHRTNMAAIECNCPVIVPGKMIVLVRAAGISVIGITTWQNGVSPSIMFAWVNAIPPLTSTRWLMKETTKTTA